MSIKMLPFSRRSDSGAMKIESLLGMVVIALLFFASGWLITNPGLWQQVAVLRFVQETNLMLLAPEAIILMVVLVSVLHVSFAKNPTERKFTWWLAAMGVFAAFICLVLHFILIYPQGPDYVQLTVGQKLMAAMRLDFLSSGEWLSSTVSFSPNTREFPMFQADLFSLIVRMLLTFGTFLVLLFTRTFLEKRSEVPGEFYIILLSALFGGMLLSGAADLIMVFVCLETLSISSYILVAYLRGNVLSAEAGLKYLLYGGMATAILLFGFSIVYGLAGSTSFPQLAFALARVPEEQLMLVAIMTVMIVGGIAFKLSAAPFHMWAPDVYEGAPTPVVAFLSVISKIAGFALALRLFTTLFLAIPGAWFGLLAVLSVLSMILGNVVALTQRNIKRLLAYSTVAHVGYLLLGLVILTPEGMSSLLYYLATYLFMNLGAFAVVTYFENTTGRDDIAAYAGLVRKRPLLALTFTVMLLSLAGIPITAGFFGKFFLFQAVAAAGSQYLWLVIIALLTSTISLYYYLNVVRLMVIADPSDAVAALPDVEPQGSPLSVRPAMLAMLVCMVGTLLLGFAAQPAMTLSHQAILEMAKGSAYAFKTPEGSLSQVPSVRR
jgi:NAD(P)H-quinone oxidoreductase subunit 2